MDDATRYTGHRPQCWSGASSTACGRPNGLVPECQRASAVSVPAANGTFRPVRPTSSVCTGASATAMGTIETTRRMKKTRRVTFSAPIADERHVQHHGSGESRLAGHMVTLRVSACSVGRARGGPRVWSASPKTAAIASSTTATPSAAAQAWPRGFASSRAAVADAPVPSSAIPRPRPRRRCRHARPPRPLRARVAQAGPRTKPRICGACRSRETGSTTAWV